MNRPHFRRRPRPTDTRPWLEVTPEMLASVLASTHRRKVTTDDATPLRTADYRTTQRGEDRYTWADPEPEYSRLDRLDGLGTRYDAVLDSGPADPEPTRYDAQWPDVRAAEAGGWAGGDLAAMTAPLTGWGEYEVEPEPGVGPGGTYMYVLPEASSPKPVRPDLPMVRAAATAYDLGLPVPLRSDPPLYRASLAGHVGAGVA